MIKVPSIVTKSAGHKLTVIRRLTVVGGVLQKFILFQESEVNC